jgi:peptide/nickel transport system substrate-binding protein
MMCGLLIVLVACSPAAPPSTTGAPSSSGNPQAARPAAPKRVIVGAREAAPVLSVALDGHADVVQELVSSGLVRFDPRGEPLPLLAEAVPSVENGLWKVTPDGRMEVTWKLREGLKWHDGTPITTDDLLFTVQVGQDRELTDFGHAAYNALEGVRAVDARTLVSQWKQPYIQADMMFSWELALPLPKHLLEDAYLNQKASFAQHRYWSHDFVHAGPFRVREFVPTERLVLDAFEGYALGRPVMDQVEVRFIADFNTMVANLIAGEVHFTIGPGIAADQAMTVQERWQEGKMGTYPYQGATVARPQFQNPQPAAQADVRFRRALYHAIDREALNQHVTAGLAPTSGFTVPPGAPEFAAINSAVVQYPYDQRRATQLIEEAGFTRVDDMYRDASGNELAIEIQVAGSDTGQEQAALFLADAWQRVGVRGVPKILSAAAATREVRATRPGFEVSSFSIATRQPVRMIWFHSKDIPSQENRFRGSNFSRYASPELDGLVDRFLSTVPTQERIEVLKQVARLVTDQVVVMSLYHTVHASLINNRAQNVTPRTGQAQTWDSHKWDLQ